MTPGLAPRLRAETQRPHRDVERTDFVQALLRGELSTEAYLDLLVNLRVIYRALERQLEAHAAHPAVAAVQDPRLARSAALDADLATLGRTDLTTAVVPAARAYAASLNAIADSAAHRLVAHAYVRYLGDLSGGQRLSTIVERSIEGAADGGRRFYDFGDASRVRELAERLRAGLDAVPEGHWDEIVAEALDAFARHTTLFEQLEDQRRKSDRIRS